MNGNPQVVLVAGAAGGVGEAIVAAALAGGDRVIALSRSDERLARLRASVSGTERLVTLAGDVGTEKGAERLRDQALRAAPRIDFAVASLGGWWVGESLLAVGLAEWDRVMHEMLTTHFVFARAFLPVLLAQASGTYIGIGGGAALLPVRGSSIVSIAGAAQIMLTRALNAECAGRGVRVLELLVNGPIKTRDTPAGIGDGWITSADVGTVVAELVATGTTTWRATRTDGPLLSMDPRTVS